MAQAVPAALASRSWVATSTRCNVDASGTAFHVPILASQFQWSHSQAETKRQTLNKDVIPSAAAVSAEASPLTCVVPPLPFLSASVHEIDEPSSARPREPCRASGGLSALACWTYKWNTDGPLQELAITALRCEKDRGPGDSDSAIETKADDAALVLALLLRCAVAVASWTGLSAVRFWDSDISSSLLLERASTPKHGGPGSPIIHAACQLIYPVGSGGATVKQRLTSIPMIYCPGVLEDTSAKPDMSWTTLQANNWL
jgi:hypothetical protein